MKHYQYLCGLFVLAASVAFGQTYVSPITPAAADAPVVIGQWHSNLSAAKLKAKELHVPMLVIWGDPGCAYCKKFDVVLTNDVTKAYFAGRGLVMVYEKSAAAAGTAIKVWAGYGDWPVLRVTWWKSDGTVVDSGQSGWNRPITFVNFKNTLESYIGAYTYKAEPPDLSKDKYDPTNDVASAATVLTWTDQVQSETLKLAKKTIAPAYTDTNDWFKLAVEAGKTYFVSATNVMGATTDVPRIGLYGNEAATVVIQGPVNLANANFEYVPAQSGDLYVKVWRPTVTDTNILYTLKYMRRAVGQAEFVATSTSVSEKAASVSLTLRRVGGTSGTAQVSVGYADSQNSVHTATAGEDFSAAPQVVTWADGDSANKTVTVPLIKNVAQWEGDETFGVTLTPDAAVSPLLTVGGAATVTLMEADSFSIATRNPTPASGSVLLARDVATFAWEDVINVAGDTTGKRFYSLYAGTSAYSMGLIAADLTAAEVDLSTNAQFQALIASANTKPIYWRVDTVYKGGVTPSVTKGSAWTVTVLPAGSPEFTEAGDVQATNLFVGVQANVGPLLFTNGLGGTPSVAVATGGGSLPMGLRLEIRNGSEVWLAGVPSRIGAGSVLVQLKTKVGMTTQPGTTVRIYYQISALPGNAVGSYQGWVGDLEEGVQGTIALSVSASGRVTGNAMFPTGVEGYSGRYSFSSTAYQAVSNGLSWISGYMTRTGVAAVPVWFSVSQADGRIEGAMGAPGAQTPVTLYRDNWKDAGMAALAAQYNGYYTAAFPVIMAWPDDAPRGSGYATFTLSGLGKFKVAGKLADGTSLSQSGTLFVERGASGETNVCALLYSAPSAYKGGLFAGVVCFGDFNTNGVKDIGRFDNAPLHWTSYNPQAVPVYDAENPGFDETLGVTGGWYNKLENLQAFYAGKVLSVGDLEQPPSISFKLSVRELNDLGGIDTTSSIESADPAAWQSITNALTVTPKADGSGFTLPAADLLLLGKDSDGAPIYNYDSAANPSGLKMTFSRATGLMSGSFNALYDYATVADLTGDEPKYTWTHTVKTCAYAAVLLPERIDLLDNTEGAGYYLFGDTATYETDTGYTRSYSVNRSFDFTLESEPVAVEPQ